MTAQRNATGSLLSQQPLERRTIECIGLFDVAQMSGICKNADRRTAQLGSHLLVQ